jgi:hypothetical protein
MLDLLFQHKLTFGLRWALKGKANPLLKCESASSEDRKKACIKVPTAQILGQTVDLPSVAAFSARSLLYPQTLIGMIASRDRLADASASYRTFDIAVRDLKNPVKKSDQKAKLAKSLTEAVR